MEATGRASEEVKREVIAQLRVSIRVERFRSRSSTSSEPFCLRETKDVMTTADSALPNETIHFLRLTESHRLHIHIEAEHHGPLTIGDIDSVSVHLPDSRPVDLPASVLKCDDKCREIVALLDPTRCTSPVIHTVSPSFGRVDRRYAQLHVKIRAHHVDDATITYDLNRTVYCKMVRQKSRLRLHRLVRAARGCCGSMFQRMRDSARRLSRHAANGHISTHDK